MNWLNVSGLMGYALLVVTCGYGVVGLALGRWPAQVSRWLAGLISAAAVFGGSLATMSVVPDWNPFTHGAVFAPMWAFAVWASRYSRLLTVGVESRRARWKALVWAVLALPLAIVAWWVAWQLSLPGAVVAAIILYVKRPTTSRTAEVDSCS